MQEVLVNRVGDLKLPRKSVVRLTDRPDMTLDVYRGRKTTTQQQQQSLKEDILLFFICCHKNANLEHFKTFLIFYFGKTDVVRWTLTLDFV